MENALVPHSAQSELPCAALHKQAAGEIFVIMDFFVVENRLHGKNSTLFLITARQRPQKYAPNSRSHFFAVPAFNSLFSDFHPPFSIETYDSAPNIVK